MKANRKYILCTLLFAICLSYSAFAQTTKFSLKSNNTKSLSQLISELTINYEIEFSYPTALIKNHKINPFRINTDNLSELIKLILKDTDLDFKIIDEQKVLLRPRRKKSKNSNDKIKISGVVKDSSGQLLSFVDVILDTLFIGSSTDHNGYFEFEISQEFIDRNISFHYIGYEEIIKSIKELKLNPTTTLNPTITTIDEVLVVEEVKDITIDPDNLRTTVQAEYLNKTVASPVISNDIVRSIQMISGVEATNDLDASIRIRGSQGDETLIIVDGIPIYKAEHFYGIFGSINANHINSVSIHKNVLPIEFGGKSGGLVQLKSKDYFNKVSGELDVNMLTSALTLSAPLSKEWSFIASGRTTYSNAADSKIFGWVEPGPEEEILNGFIGERPLLLNTSPALRFYDINGKFLFRPNENHLYSFSFFKSQDNFTNGYDITFSNPRTIGSIDGEEEFNDQEDWSNFGISLNHTGIFKNNWKINTRIFNSNFDYAGALSTSIRFEGNPANTLTNQKNNEINDWGFHTILSKKLNNDQLSIGLSGVHHNVAFGFKADESRTFNLSATGWESAIFSSYDWAISENWNINVGSRFDYYSETEKSYFAPRISSIFKLSNNFLLKAAYAQHYQFLREITFYSRLREPLDIFLLTTDGKNNRTYPVGSTSNTMLGFSFLKNRWVMDLEFYNKSMTGVVEHTQVVVGQSDNEISAPNRINRAVTGTGRSYGADLSIGYQDKSLSSSLAYTLSKTTNQFEEIFQNEAIPAESDRRHQLKLVNQLDLGKWSITGNYIFSSGRSQLNLFDQEDALDLSSVLTNQSFTRLDPYHRVDLGVSYGFQLDDKKVSIGLSVLNATNNKNVDYIQYLFRVPTRRGTNNKKLISGTTTQLLDRTFNLTLKLGW